LRIEPSRAPANHTSAASATVVGVGARIMPLRTDTAASCLHARAAASVEKVFRSFRPSRLENTKAS
jgi:hypothetical protein